MKILLVSSYLPYPLTNGGHIRLNNLLKYLQKEHEITLICEKRPEQTEEDVKEVEKICHKVITVPRKKQWSLSNILKSGFSNQPFLIVGHTSSEMREAISSELITTNYQLLHVETFYVMQNIPATDLPIILVEHNIEYQVYERFAKRIAFYLRPLLNADIKKIKRIEKESWKRAATVVTVSREDQEVIDQTNYHTEVVPNGVDLKAFRFSRRSGIPHLRGKIGDFRFQKTEKKVLYIGDYSWIQNRDAAEFIIRDVWPHIKEISDKRQVISRLWLVGRNMPQSLKALGKDNPDIIFDDNNKMTTSEIFSEADVLLAPKRVGGGTSYKILEALAVGTPVVTTSLGLEGLELQMDKDVLVSDSAEDLAEQVVNLLSDEKLYKSLAESGRKKVEENYDWDSIAKKLDEVYTSAASRG